MNYLTQKLIAFFYTFLLRKGESRVGHTLPMWLGEYKYVKSLRLQKSHALSLGIYKSRQGKKVIAKIWMGDFKDINYFTLLHEIRTMRTLNKVHERIKARIPKDLRRFEFAKFVASYESKNYLALMMEEIKGKGLSSMSSQDAQYGVYCHAIRFLRTVGNKCNLHEKRIISQKSVFNFGIIFPLIFITSILKRPKMSKDLLAGVGVFIVGVSQLWQRRSYVLVHGDLHPENIMLTKKGIFIFDLGQSMFTYPEYELIATISSRKVKNTFETMVLGDLVSTAQKSSFDLRCVKSLVVNCSIHNLASNLPLQNINKYLRVLKIGISSNLSKTAII